MKDRFSCLLLTAAENLYIEIPQITLVSISDIQASHSRRNKSSILRSNEKVAPRQEPS